MQYEFAIFMNDRGCNFTIQYFVYVANGHSKISTTSLSINHSIYDPAVDTEGIKKWYLRGFPSRRYYPHFITQLSFERMRCELLDDSGLLYAVTVHRGYICHLIIGSMSSFGELVSLIYNGSATYNTGELLVSNRPKIKIDETSGQIPQIVTLKYLHSILSHLFFAVKLKHNNRKQ